jgi:hypothetical protein
MELEDLLLDKQRLIADCTGLMRRLRELSISGCWKSAEAARTLGRPAGEHMATDRFLGRLAEFRRALVEP